MKFIHTADLHLDTPFEGIKNDIETPTSLWQALKQAPYDSFEKIIDQALEQQIDFMLIAGDIFDSNNQSVKALSFFIEQMNRLNDAKIPVMLSFGNHDFQPDAGNHFDFPDNVFVFPKDITTHTLNLKDGKTVSITSFSYPTQAITDDLVKDYPLKEKVDYQIGMVHGEIGKDQESNYAPFSISKMVNKGYDYWALGHIHKRMELNANPMIEYPGDIQGRHKNESGEKGYLLISDHDGQLTKNFVATSPIIFSPMEIDVDGSMNISNIIDQILIELQSQKFTKLHLININLKSKNGQFASDVVQGMPENILTNSLQQSLAPQYQALNAWVYKIKLTTNLEKNFTNLDQQFWDDSSAAVFSKENVAKLAGKLFVEDFIRTEFSDDEALQNLRQTSIELLNSKIQGGDYNYDN